MPHHVADVVQLEHRRPRSVSGHRALRPSPVAEAFGRGARLVGERCGKIVEQGLLDRFGRAARTSDHLKRAVDLRQSKVSPDVRTDRLVQRRPKSRLLRIESFDRASIGVDGHEWSDLDARDEIGSCAE
ncbi:MAG: hypothetical protein U0575_06580 [Phycisphaerales bacterium]